MMWLVLVLVSLIGFAVAINLVKRRIKETEESLRVRLENERQNLSDDLEQLKNSQDILNLPELLLRAKRRRDRRSKRSGRPGGSDSESK